MKKVNIGIDSCGCFNIFMVNEAEAAAMHTLTSTFHDFMVRKFDSLTNVPWIRKLTAASRVKYSCYWIVGEALRTSEFTKSVANTLSGWVKKSFLR